MAKKKEKKASLPTAQQIEPLLAAQARYNRVGVETPFGAQNYRTNQDGSTSLVTSLGPQGQALVDRSMGLAMTDSQQMGVPHQVNQLANALANRAGARFGLQPRNDTQVGAQQMNKPPQTQQMPPPNGGP